MSDTQLINKYRPKTFEEVIGHDTQTKAVKAALDTKRSSVFLLSGPAGTGKTSIARIACAYAGIKKGDIFEVDAASNTGVDDMRKVAETMRFLSLGGTGRAAIVDECHRLSGNAWDSLLKAMEEPRAGHLWFFCSTNPSKIPKTVQSRGIKVVLKPLTQKQLDKLVLHVIEEEGLSITDPAIDVVIEKADGSPRQALSNLAACADARTRAEAIELLDAGTESNAVRELCQFVLKPTSVTSLEKILEKCAGESAEGIRIQVLLYLNAVAKNSKTDKQYVSAIKLMACFRHSYGVSAEGLAPLRISLADAIFNLGMST